MEKTVRKQILRNTIEGFVWFMFELTKGFKSLTLVAINQPKQVEIITKPKGENNE